jgi:2-polyprenyl-3-methyl-5-hydroxy-6-metoxy-1,4-benzoquinol methylase
MARLSAMTAIALPVEDPVEAAAVQSGWLLVNAYEQLGSAPAGRMFAADLSTSFQRARAIVADLAPWKGLGPKATAVYQNDHNRLRFCRTLDFVREGDHVFDIGLGRGYLCGVLLQDGRIDSYHGVDIVAKNVEATRQMVVANGLTGAEIDVSVGDLYDLTAERVAASRPDLVICCEVLEHVADPERALRILADTLPDGAELLISVPLYGRLERVWGHVTIFDAARVRAMVEAAGLWVHHVEPLANTWTLLLLSRNPAASERARIAAVRRQGVTFDPQLTHRDFVPVAPATASPAPWSSRAATSLAIEESGVRCSVRSAPWQRLLARPTRGGLTFPVHGMYGLRLEFGTEDLTNVTRMHIDGYAGEVRAGRWTWTPATKRNGPARRTVVVHAGRSNGFFKATEPFGDVSQVDRVELVIEVAAGALASFVLHRAAYLH